MDLSRIEKLLIPGRDVDLDALYAQFRAAHGAQGLDRFMLFLFEQGHIDAGDLTWVGDAEAVKAARLADLPEYGDDTFGGSASGSRRDAGGVRADPAAREAADGETFQVIETIGRGGMGSVALARDPSLQRYVAYKQLHDHRESEAAALERFNFEAQVTAQLDHPNIVPVYSYDSGRGYAMKLIAGRSLADVLEQARAQHEAGTVDEDHSLAALLEGFLKVCDAVHYAHSKGVVHRDLKPRNILVGRHNEVYVVDWGIAKLLAGDHGIAGADASGGEDAISVRVSDAAARGHAETGAGDILGTPGYISPEQVLGDSAAVGAHSDVFCLGLILYEIVNLRRAYAEGPLRDLMLHMARAEIQPMTARCVHGTAAREMEAIIAKACAREPERRYADVQALANDVRRFLRREEISARRDGPLQRLVRWVGHHREATMLIVAAVVLAGAGVSMWSVYARQQAIIAAKAHEERIAALVVSVAGRAQSIERHFLGFEAIVEGLAAAAAQLVLRGVPSDEPVYTNDDYLRAGGAPPDYLPSAAYGRAISLDHSVFKLAPGVTRDAVATLLGRLAPLRHHFKQTMFESVGGPDWTRHERTVGARVREHGAALTWTYVGLAEGVHVAYPGKGGYPPEYDPRARPWYRYSIGRHGTTWLAPYVDVGGRGLVVPCTRPVRAPDGTLIGVAGVETTLDHIREDLLDMSGESDIRATYLLDENGFVVSSSGDTPQAFALGTLIADLADLKRYPDDAVVERIASGVSGHVARVDGARERVVVYQRLGSVRWYLVAEAVLAGER